MHITEFSKKYGLSKSIVEESFQKLANNEVIFVAVSGKMGSGKDTVAPLILERLGYKNNIHESFAKELKAEINTLISLIQESKGLHDAIQKMIEVIDPLVLPAIEVLAYIYGDVKTGVVKNSTDRNPNMRRALQEWGTEVRRAEEENYWVKKSLKNIFNQLSNGVSVYVTDARFQNEINSIMESRGKTIRLLVNKEEQAARIRLRDNIEVTEQMRNHASELDLDNYTNFSQIIDTNYRTINEVVEESVKGLL